MTLIGLSDLSCICDVYFLSPTFILIFLLSINLKTHHFILFLCFIFPYLVLYLCLLAGIHNYMQWIYWNLRKHKLDIPLTIFRIAFSRNSHCLILSFRIKEIIIFQNFISLERDNSVPSIPFRSGNLSLRSCL